MRKEGIRKILLMALMIFTISTSGKLAAGRAEVKTPAFRPSCVHEKIAAGPSTGFSSILTIIHDTDQGDAARFTKGRGKG